MANGYILLNSKRYKTAERSFKAISFVPKQMNYTVGGKTASQNFGFTLYRWEMDIWVELSPVDSNYGSWANLLAAYTPSYVPFTDVFGTSQGNVYLEGELPQMPEYALVDPAVPFKVPLNLKQRVP